MFLSTISEPSALWDAQVKLAQALVGFGVLAVAWRQSEAAIVQLAQNQTKHRQEQLDALRQEVQRLKDAKPIIFIEAAEGTGYQLVNVGKALAVNVWIVDENGQPRPLGSLRPNEARAFKAPGHRQLLIAEARPHRPEVHANRESHHAGWQRLSCLP
jgi:hypothetical protein